MNSKTAFITGISGQDGRYLAELLLSKGYQVHDLIRRSSSPNLYRIEHILDRVSLHVDDVTDGACLQSLFSLIRPKEIYNLAAQSFKPDEIRKNFDCVKLLISSPCNIIGKGSRKRRCI